MLRLIAALILLASAVVHFGTYFGVVWPQWVMWQHGVVLLLFAVGGFATILVGSGHGKGSVVVRAAPHWLKVMTVVLGIYAGINFVLFMVLSEGGRPAERPNGTYYLANGSDFVRDLTPEEYRFQMALVFRGFSGHWMLFSSAALMLLWGANTYYWSTRKERATFEEAEEKAAEAAAAEEKAYRLRARALFARPAGSWQRVAAGFIYVATASLLLAGGPCVLLALPALIYYGVRGIRWMQASGGQFATAGCFIVVPNFFLAGRLGWRIPETLIAILYAGPGKVFSGQVVFDYLAVGPPALSDGTLVNGRLIGAGGFVTFLLCVIGTLGMTQMVQTVFGDRLPRRKLPG